jgi:hypothetical protein
VISPVRREAAEIREEWLGWALSTLPADRPAAEAAISELYRLIGLAPPRFHWVSSPMAGLETVPPGGRVSEWSVTPKFVTLVQELRHRLDARITWAQQERERLVRLTVRQSLSRSANSTFLAQLRPLHDPYDRQWSRTYEYQCFSWIAHYDALRRAAGVVFEPRQNGLLDLWAAAARSCRWWRPHEDVCVVSERPLALHTEVWGSDGEVRPHHADGPSVRYVDGWDFHAWHGTPVPTWVIDDPTVERIAREPNVEVRRCAIERIGWAPYIELAGLRLVATAPDPGNPGSELRLYDLRKETKVLLAVNGSAERDGHRRRYGLTVPGFMNDPVEAAGWTYGLSADQYSLLLRRT